MPFKGKSDQQPKGLSKIPRKTRWPRFAAKDKTSKKIAKDPELASLYRDLLFGRTGILGKRSETAGDSEIRHEFDAMKKKLEAVELELAAIKYTRFSDTLVPIERDAILPDDVAWGISKSKGTLDAKRIADVGKSVSERSPQALNEASSNGERDRASLLASSLAKLAAKS